MDDHAVRSQSRIFLRPIANPVPMGLIGLGGGTTMLSALQLGWVAVSESTQIGILVLAIAVPLQFLASAVGYLARDAAATTGFGTLAVAWLCTGLITALGTPGSRSRALGLLLLYVAAGVLISAIAAALTKALMATVLVFATARFAVTGIYEYFGGSTWQTAAGWLGIALSVLAVYAALAFEIESSLHRTVLPTVRRGAGRASLRAPGLETTGSPQGEPGVRDQP